MSRLRSLLTTAKKESSEEIKSIFQMALTGDGAKTREMLDNLKSEGKISDSEYKEIYDSCMVIITYCY